MNQEDIEAFWADETSLNFDDHVIFHYVFETTLSPSEAAAHLCSETSTAQWKRPDCDEDFRPKFAAKVLDVETIEESKTSVFNADFGSGNKFTRARARIAHPFANFGTALPNLLTVAMGEGAFFCGGITAIKLIDIEFPDKYLKSFQGPRFGTRGIRHVLDVTDRPLFFGVVKPNIGLDPRSFAELAKEAWLGGLDAAKDDEMLASPNYSPFEERMRQVGRARQEAEDATGEKKMFIANITDEVDSIKLLHDIALEHGINAVMLNVMTVGLSAVRMLRKYSQVPIIAHFDCIAPMSRHPYFGVSTQVLTKLQRLAGCDAIIMPGFGARMQTSDEEVLSNAAECSKLLGDIKSALPVPGGSDWAGTLKEMYDKLRTLDFAMVPGRGVFGHPMGPRAGATSLRQAWESILYKVSLNEYAEDHLELSEAIKTFGTQTARNTTFDEIEGLIPLARGFTGVPLFFKNN